MKTAAQESGLLMVHDGLACSVNACPLSSKLKTPPPRESDIYETNF